MSQNKKWIRYYRYWRPLFEKSENIKFKNNVFLRLAFFQKIKKVKRMKLVKLSNIWSLQSFCSKKFYAGWKRWCKAFKCKFKHKPEDLHCASYITPILLLRRLSTPVWSHHESRIPVFGSFTARLKWLLAYFFLYSLCFEIFPNAKNLIAVSSELRPDTFLFENKTALFEVFEHFYDEKK